MNKLILSALLSLPAAAFGQALNGADLDGASPARLEDIGAPAPARPNPAKMMSEISAALRLSSKQEDRIAKAVDKRTADFDKVMKEYVKASDEEKRWRFKMNEARYELVKITRSLPDTVRDYLDDEQREAFDELIESRRKPAGGELEEGAAPPPARKKLIKRKKAPAPAAGPAEDPEGGQTLVDKEAPKAGPKRKLVKRKKAPAAKAAPAPAPAEPAAEEPAAEAPAAEEDAGSYP